MAGMPMHDIAMLALVIFFFAAGYVVYGLYDLLREIEGFRRDYQRAHNLDSN